jgi:hypothetical protein
VEYEALIKTLKADPRVQASASLDVTNEDFAKASVLLADAFARGDASKLKPMLTKRGQNVLGDLQATGLWSDATQKIEAVRIVFAGPPSSLSSMEFEKAIKEMTEAAEAEAVRYEQQLEARGVDPEYRAKVVAAKRAENLAAIQGHTLDEAAAIKAEMAMLIAVKTEAGAELLGFTGAKAGEGWVFNNASTTGEVRASATKWDNVGMLGFSVGSGRKAKKSEEKLPDAVKPDGGAPGAPGAPGKPAAPAGPGERGPIRSPAGPIRVPGGSS